MSLSPATRLHIGVIGADTAGMATAIAFARAGHTVDVLKNTRRRQRLAPVY
jgi:2-polyprenyl-6-methoxyphenol hydroxylase-like FAD-dependent oxidoreductase